MAKYSAQLKATSSQGRTVTTSISNVNPEVPTQTIKLFAQRLNQLTTNTYNETEYIVTTNLDTDTRTDTTMTLTNAEFFTGITSSSKFSTFTTNSDGEVSIVVNGNHGILVGIVSDSGTTSFCAKPQGATQSSGTITIRVEGTDTYKPFEQTYDFT